MGNASPQLARLVYLAAAGLHWDEAADEAEAGTAVAGDQCELGRARPLPAIGKQPNALPAARSAPTKL